MNGRPIFLVLREQVLGRLLDRPNLATEPYVDHANESARLDELDDVGQVALVSAKVEIRVDGDYRVKEFFRKRQTVRVYPHGKHTRLHIERDGPLKVLSGGSAAVGSPNLDLELARQENRAGRLAAPKFQDPHAGIERKVARQALRLAQCIFAKRILANPAFVVLRRPRKSQLIDQRFHSKRNLVAPAGPARRNS